MARAVPIDDANGTSDVDTAVAVRFWRLWTGNKGCRELVTKAAKDSFWRQPNAIEAQLLRLHRFAPFADWPIIVMREPRILLIEPHLIPSQLVALKRVLGGTVDPIALCTLAPGLLLAEPAELAAGVAALAAEECGDRARVLERVRASPNLLIGIEAWEGGSRAGEYQRVVPPIKTRASSTESPNGAEG